MLSSPTAPRWIAAACLLVGLLAAAHPLYIFPNYGQPAYETEVWSVDSVPGDDEPVAVEDLPPRARAAVEADISGGEVILYVGDHDTSIEALDQTTVAWYRGELYWVDISPTRGAPWYAGPARGALSIAGGFLVAVGLLVGLTGEFRPATPVRAGAVPLIALGIAVVTLRPGALASTDLGVPEVIVVLTVLALYVPPASEAAKSRARGTGRFDVVLGIAAAFVVGGIAAALIEMPTAIYPVGGLATTVCYLLAPAER